MLACSQATRTSAAEKSQAIVAKTLSRAPVYPPGSRYLYTGIDYLIVGSLLKKVTGLPWGDLIREKLRQPLGITNGGFGAPGTPGKIDQPWGHWGMVFTGRPVAPDGFFSRLNPPAFYGPAATARMTISDWAKFVSIHLRGDPANPHHSALLLKPDSFVALHQTAPGKFYESGWMLSTQAWAHGHRPGDTGRVITSEGDNGFWHCDPWLAPEIDFAVLILINQGNAAGPTSAGLGVHAAFTALVRRCRTEKCGIAARSQR
ncbi:MAG: serine hydrolase [Opitutaceae bacterium]